MRILEKINVTIVNAINELYNDTMYIHKIENKVSNGFKVTEGRKYNSCLSPILYKNEVHR